MFNDPFMHRLYIESFQITRGQKLLQLWNEDKSRFFQGALPLLASYDQMDNFQRAMFDELMLDGAAYAYAGVIGPLNKHLPDDFSWMKSLLDEYWGEVKSPGYGWVYLVEAINQDGLYKLGKSKKPFQRVAKLGKAGLKFRCKKRLIHLIQSPSYGKVEAILKRWHADYHYISEWFRLLPEHIEFLKKHQFMEADKKGNLMGY